MSEIVAGGAMIPDKLEEVYLDAARDAIGDVKSVKLDVLVGAVTESDADARLELAHPTNHHVFIHVAVRAGCRIDTDSCIEDSEIGKRARAEGSVSV